MKLKSTALHSALHTGEAVGHPVYFALVAAFGHGPYAIAAGVMAVIALLMLIVVEG
jgi:hypothetical protein